MQVCYAKGSKSKLYNRYSYTQFRNFSRMPKQTFNNRQKSSVSALTQMTDIINFRILQTFALPLRLRQSATIAQCTSLYYIFTRSYMLYSRLKPTFNDLTSIWIQILYIREPQRIFKIGRQIRYLLLSYHIRSIIAYNHLMKADSHSV